MTLLFSGVILVFSSCKHKPDDADPCVGIIPASVSFQNDLLPVFRESCSNPGCHSGGSPAAHLNLEDSVAYSQLMKAGTGNIDTAQPENSVLYGSMTTSSKIMPPAGKLNTCKTELVLKWIQQGAKNN